jgi:hypothetical protein
MKIYMIRGFSGSGKDTLGSCFVSHYGFTRLAFADSLKSIVSQKYNIPEIVLHSQEGKKQICLENGKTWREILIEEAANLRNNDPDIFAKMCAKKISLLGCENIVFTDWRYPNELQIIQEEFPDAMIVKIHMIREGQKESPVNSPTEYLLEKDIPDILFYNDGKSDMLPELKKIMDN